MSVIHTSKQTPRCIVRYSTANQPPHCAAIVKKLITSQRPYRDINWIANPSSWHTNLIGGTDLWYRSFQVLLHNKPGNYDQGYVNKSSELTSYMVAHNTSSYLYFQPTWFEQRTLLAEPDWNWYGNQSYSAYYGASIYYDTAPTGDESYLAKFKINNDEETDMEFNRIACTGNYIFLAEGNSSLNLSANDLEAYVCIDVSGAYHMSYSEILENPVSYKNVKVEYYNQIPWDTSKSGYLFIVSVESIFNNITSYCPNPVVINYPFFRLTNSNNLKKVTFYGKSVNFEGDFK